jgi:predicted GTPase
MYTIGRGNMINKTIINEHLNNFEKLSTEITITNTLNEQIEALKQAANHFSLKILTIGAFSAGKSALMNALLDRDLLAEEQTPETAIATELTFNPIESIELVDNNQQRRRVDASDLQAVNPSDYMNIRYNLNTHFLEKFKDYTFVDMPGFNSNIEQHNKAILQYADKGNAYVLVIDCEDGSIKSSALDFIEEIRQYEQNLIIVISKADKKAPSDLKAIQEKIKMQADFLFNYDVPVVTYSKYNEESIENVINAILTLNSQNIFEQAIFPKVKEIYEFFDVAAKQYIQSLSYDDHDLKEEINNREKSKEALAYKLESERSKLSRRLNTQMLPNILSDLESALYAHSADLAQAAISGSNAFSSRVNTILRPVLLESTKKYSDLSFEEFLNDLNLSELLTDKTEEIATTIAEKIQTVSTILSRGEQATTGKAAENFNKIYKSVTAALAITTSAVAPWLEIIILFLPEILKMFGVGSEKAQLDKVKQKIEGEVIPQIVAKLTPAIQESLVEMEAMMIEELEQNLKMIMSVEEEALQQALTNRQQLITTYETELQKYEAVCVTIHTELQKLEV